MRRIISMTIIRLEKAALEVFTGVVQVQASRQISFLSFLFIYSLILIFLKLIFYMLN